MRSLLRKSVLAMNASDLDGLTVTQLNEFLTRLESLRLTKAPIAAIARDRVACAQSGLNALRA